MEPLSPERRKAFTRMDLLLIVILLAAGGCLLFFRNRQESGTVIRIYSDNELLTELPLDRDDTFTVSTDLGTNKIIVENGRAYVTDADCPDRICEQMGLISKPGETIVCLPHKLIVEVNDGK